MKAKIEQIEKKMWNDKPIYNVVADGKKYTCWSPRIEGMGGKEVEFEVEEVNGKNGVYYKMKLPSEGGSGFTKGSGRGGQKSDKEIASIEHQKALAEAVNAFAVVGSAKAKDLEMDYKVIHFFYEKFLKLISSPDGKVPLEKTESEPF